MQVRNHKMNQRAEAPNKVGSEQIVPLMQVEQPLLYANEDW
jgi:hypothetical protein